MTTSDPPERYRGNLKHPLVRQAAEFQVKLREDQGAKRREISDLINECQAIQGRDDLLTSLISETSHPVEERRRCALAQLDRLFNYEPDGNAPLQQPFQFPDPPPHPALSVLQDLKDLVDTGNPSDAAVMTRIDRAMEIIEEMEE